jgi:hypothetical protein
MKHILVFSTFTSRPTFLVASDAASVSLYGIYVFSQYIKPVNIDQEVMCSFRFQSFLIFFEFTNSVF